MRDIKSDMRKIKSNQQTIIGEIYGIEKFFAEVLRTLEKIAKSVENPAKDTSPPAFDVHTEKVTSYFTVYITLQILLLYSLWDLTVYIALILCYTSYYFWQEDEKNNDEKNEQVFETPDDASVNVSKCGDKVAC